MWAQWVRSVVLTCPMLLSDTIPGRQCMASCFFLLRQFDDVLVYLNSIKVKWFPQEMRLCCELIVFSQSYFFNDDVFNFNYAQAKASTGNFQEAEEVFLLINSEKIKNDYVYLSWLARCCEPLSFPPLFCSSAPSHVPRLLCMSPPASA